MEENKGNKRNSSKRAVLVMVLVLAVAGLVCAVTLMIVNAAARAKDEANQTAIAADAHAATPAPTAAAAALPDAPMQTATPVPTPVPTPTPVPLWYDAYARTPDRTINFAELKSKNPAIYAWISVPGTDIDYPVVHADKFDETYLTHDAYLQESKMGAIYTDGLNAGDLSDRMTLIFGHNMKDGSMFAGLHKFRDAVFFEGNDTVKLYMGEVELDYRIFAAYKTTNEHILVTRDFKNDAVFADYIAGVFDSRDLASNFREIDITPDDRVITLCTCVKGEPDNRLFVQAVLLENE